MPTYQPAILVNGLPIDKALVLDVIERDFDVVFDALVEWQRFTSVPYDDTYDLPNWEVVRNKDVDFCCRNRCDSGGHAVLYKKFASKRKEVK